MAKLAPLTFRISTLWGSTQGTIEKHHVDIKLNYPDESLKFSSNFVAEIMLIKLKNEICAIITDATVSVELVCQFCLKDITQVISIPATEREFLHELPGKDEIIEDEADLYVIDRKTMTVDLSEIVRQEIILHFPLIPVCSKGCKGLCAHCGNDQNKHPCKCKNVEETEGNKPFANLKNLLK